MGKKVASRAKGAGTVYLDGKLYRARWVVGGKVFTRFDFSLRIFPIGRKRGASAFTV